MIKYKEFIPENIAPKKATRIVICDSDNKIVGYVNLGHLKQPNKNKNYSFTLLADIHITYETASDDFIRALTYTENSDSLFTVIDGDLTQNGSDEQVNQYKAIVDTYAVSKSVYAIGGNHETVLGYMTDERISSYTGHPMCYTVTQGDDVFIMVSHYGVYHGDDLGWYNYEFVASWQLQWLYETLEANRNKRCFLFNHVYPYEDGVGDANRYYNGRYWNTVDGSIGQAYRELLLHYKNVTLFHGHSHLRFALQSDDDKANYGYVGYRSVHVPSLSVPRDRIDGVTSYVYAESEGYIVDVYDDYIILNGRDFIDNDNDGNILPIATYKIDTKLVEIEANTFTDSTGTITT